MRSTVGRIVDAAIPQRVTTRGDYLAAVDGLRFLAIAWVLLFHLNAYFTGKTGIAPGNALERAAAAIFAEGDWGVGLFFVISGFILGLPFAAQHALGGKPVLLKTYFLRRLTRLEAPYVLSLLAAGLGVVAIGRESVLEAVSHLGAHLIYLHELIHRDGGLNPVAWSLEIEVQFYLLVPWLALVFKLPTRTRRPLLVVAILAFGGLGLTLGHAGAPRSILQYLHLFLCGFLLADVHLHDRAEARSSRRIDLFDPVGSLLFLSLPLLVLHEYSAAFLAPLAITGAYACALRGPRLRRLFTGLAISRLGGACYSMYLLHVLVLSAVGRFVVDSIDASYTVGLTVLALVTVPAILIASIVFYRTVELPCMRPDWPARLKQALLGPTPEPEPVP